MANDALLRLKNRCLFPDLPEAEKTALIDEALLLLVGPDQQDAVYANQVIGAIPASQVPRFLKTLRQTLLDRVIRDRSIGLGPVAVKYLAMHIRLHPKSAETTLSLLRPEVAVRVRRALAEFEQEWHA